MKEIGRNDPCSCGSGLKYKKCCWAKQQPQKKKLTAKVMSSGAGMMQRAFTGASMASAAKVNQETQIEENQKNNESVDKNT